MFKTIIEYYTETDGLRFQPRGTKKEALKHLIKTKYEIIQKVENYTFNQYTGTTTRNIWYIIRKKRQQTLF